MGMVLDRRKSSAFNKIKTFQKRLHESHKKSFSIGLFQESGIHPDSGFSYVNLGAYLHNGAASRNLPPRPFLTMAFSWNRKTYQKLIKQALAKYLMSNDKNARLEHYIIKICQMQVRDVRATFGNTTFLASNAPSTIAKKKSDAPLIDTGKLRDHIAFRLSWSGSIQY